MKKNGDFITEKYNNRNLKIHWRIESVNLKLDQGLYWLSFSVKGKIVNMLDFAGHTVSVAPPQLCSCSMKIATDNM